MYELDNKIFKPKNTCCLFGLSIVKHRYKKTAKEEKNTISSFAELKIKGFYHSLSILKLIFCMSVKDSATRVYMPDS